MNDTQLLRRLADANAYGEGTPLPETIWTSQLALREIERRTGMEPREATDQPTITSSVEPQEAASPPIEPDRVLDAPGQHTRSRWGSRPLLVAAAAFVVVLVAGAALVAVLSLDDTIPVAGTSDDPAATIEAYVEAYNTGDIDAVMALFSEASEVTGSPLDPRGSRGSRGLSQIRTLHQVDMGAAANEDAYTISNVEVSGNTVSWDHVWVNDNGIEYCAAGHSAVIEDGKIVSWTFASDPELCP